MTVRQMVALMDELLRAELEVRNVWLDRPVQPHDAVVLLGVAKEVANKVFEETEAE